MIIYKVTNLENGKVYIGQTTTSLKERWRLHLQVAKSRRYDTKFFRAIRKYGADKFNIEEIVTCSSSDELNKTETKYIELYDSVNIGYNSNTGGDVRKASPEVRKKMSDANKGKVFSKEHCENISKGKMGSRGHKPSPEHLKALIDGSIKANTGRPISEETKSKIRQALSPMRQGENNPFFGKNHSDESRDKMRIARSIRIMPRKIDTHELDKIRQLKLNGESYESIARMYKVSSATVSNIVNRKGAISYRGWMVEDKGRR